MKKYLWFVAISVFLLYCADDTRDNPYDELAVNYIGKSSAEGSSSSVEAGEPFSSSGNEEPSSSSSIEELSSSSVEPSSSSAEPSSSSEAESSSSIAPSSSSVEPSSSSAEPSSSSVALSSSSSSSSSFRSSSSLILSSSSFVHIGKGNNISNYRTVVIGTQTWMAENFDYVVEGSKCYNNDPARCNEYGSLYNWSTAMDLPLDCNSSTCSSQIQSPHKGICPSGWHIPSQAEWNTLSSYVQSNSNICSNCDAWLLKATSGWSDGGYGKDQYEFSALPGGNGRSDSDFRNIGNIGSWWSASEHDKNYAHGRGMDYNNHLASWSYYYKSYLYSIRCVQD